MSRSSHSSPRVWPLSPWSQSRSCRRLGSARALKTLSASTPGIIGNQMVACQGPAAARLLVNLELGGYPPATMPELPDVTVYLEALEARVLGARLERVRLDSAAAAFRAALERENHTIKRALTDPYILAGIGNAYSDEILHRARLSPVKQTRSMSDEEHARLFEATRATLLEWIERLRREAGGDFPEGVTAFRPQMAVHGRYGKPCPVCGAPVQRIRHADNETNYCARCQTGGKLLADRALSRLLRADWPRAPDEVEERRGRAPQSKIGGPTRRGRS